MISLGIDSNLVTLTKSFLINRKVQLIIDRHNSKEKEIETGIPQSSLVLPIFFLIFISEVFDIVIGNTSIVTSLLFVDDLGFITSRNLG